MVVDASSGTARRWLAPAKLNLYLHVVGRRPDGYHLLDSLVAFADIGDEIAVEPAPALTLRVDGPFAAMLAGEATDNLVWGGATHLAERLGGAPGAMLTLIKNLPVAAGIGGGSSDAAATLKALLALWRPELDGATARDLACEIGVTLGADVPVCLAARTAWLGGIGERIEPAPRLPSAAVVLANPRVALATPSVFKARRGPFSPPARFAAMPADVTDLAALLTVRRNDLTEAAIGLVPAVAEVLERLTAADGALLARMSGSGATCFALFVDLAAAAAAAERLRMERPDWWVAAGRLL